MTSRFRINLQTGDVEFEGTEDFVKAQISQLAETLKSIKDNLPTFAPQPSVSAVKVPVVNGGTLPEVGASGGTDSTDMSASFGEWMHKFPADIGDQDKALVAGLFVQKSSEKNDFKTSEVNEVLKEHGFKLSNPSLSLRRLVSQKYLFQTRKEGKLRFFRVSKIGEAHIAELRNGGS